MSELNLQEIREFMLKNNCKVTNHALVKHFKKFLTNPDSQNDARKQFKEYVNVLATIKNENGEKYLVLRKKYLNEVPSEDGYAAHNTVGLPSSPDISNRSSCSSFQSEFDMMSPVGSGRQPPPYRSPPPPKVNTSNQDLSPKMPFLESQAENLYRECVDEFQIAMNALKEKDREKKMSPPSSFYSPEIISPNTVGLPLSPTEYMAPPTPPKKGNLSRQTSSDHSLKQNLSRETSIDQSQKQRPNLSRETSIDQNQNYGSSFEEKKNDLNVAKEDKENTENEENKISVKEAMQKFNRYASEEEAKVPSPLGKMPLSKKQSDAEKDSPDNSVPDNLIQHPKAKEWLVYACKSDYLKLTKLAQEFPILTKLKDPFTGWTALHWGSKHGNCDVVKLIAGTYKYNVNDRTNGGYTPLHIAMQFGKHDIFELLSNVYKADRNLTDWSGKKPLDYQKQMQSVSSSTYSKIKARKKHNEKELGFLRIGSLNARVKKTRESFKDFMGGSIKGSRYPSNVQRHLRMNQMAAQSQQNLQQRPHSDTQIHMHKSWGSADNIPKKDTDLMPPPPDKFSGKKSSVKRDTDVMGINIPQSHSAQNTPRVTRSPIGVLCEQSESSENNSDSDGACGFDDSWKLNKTPPPKSSSVQSPTYM